MTDRLSATSRASEIPLWQEDLPHAKLLPAKHRMCSAVPKIEVTHQAHRMCTWRPDCKAGSPQSWKEKSLKKVFFHVCPYFPCLCFPRIVASSHRMQTANDCDNFDLYRTFLTFERAPEKHEHYWTSLDQGALLEWQVLAYECGAPCDGHQTSCWDDAIPWL